jgi:hypothetical protein
MSPRIHWKGSKQIDFYLVRRGPTAARLLCVEAPRRVFGDT